MDMIKWLNKFFYYYKEKMHNDVLQIDKYHIETTQQTLM